MEKTARVLVTGGSGMVGQALLQRLRRDGYASILAPSSKQLDLRNQTAAHQFFTENPVDFVFHLAGHIGGIAKGERIMSARFLEDKAFLVTFRQIDPLFTIEPDPDYAYAAKLGAKYGMDLSGIDGPGESRVVVTIEPEKVYAVDVSR